MVSFEAVISAKRKMEIENAEGWARSSNHPGGYWLWEKTFPPVIWQKKITRPERTYYLPYYLPTEMAVSIQKGWSSIYEDEGK